MRAPFQLKHIMVEILSYHYQLDNKYKSLTLRKCAYCLKQNCKFELLCQV